MRKITLRISDSGKRLANKIYEQRAVEIDRQYAHIKIKALTILTMRQQEREYYFQIYAEWMKRKVRARLETYLEVFKEESVIPNDADLSEMSWAFQEIIDNFTAPLPQELSAPLQQLGRMHAIEDARRDIEIFALRAESQKPQPPSSVHYNTHIYGDNRGNVQQGGNGNIQSADRSDDETK